MGTFRTNSEELNFRDMETSYNTGKTLIWRGSNFWFNAATEFSFLEFNALILLEGKQGIQSNMEEINAALSHQMSVATFQ